MRIRLGVAGIFGIAAIVFFITRTPRNTFEYQGHHLPMDQLRVVDPHPGCEQIHYHAAASKSVTATDGTTWPDETDCGYGPAHR